RSDYCVIGELHKDKEARVISKVHTHEVIQNAKDIIGYCKEDILLFAHNAHYKRVSEIAKHSGINGKPFLRTPVTWVPNDPQPFVRSQLIWAGLEISARIRDKYIYKVI
ncbi:MAG: hypothetical protein ACE5ES_05080, partial [Candidatus Nanoarchaeia archaeon]